MHTTGADARNHRSLLKAALGLTGAALVALTGCTSDSAAQGSGAGGATPRPGGTLTFALGDEVRCIDPQQAGDGAELTAARGLVDSLTVRDPGTGRLGPWLATSWQASANAESFTFTLRPGVTFSDGTALTATAVKAALDGDVALGARAILASGYLTGYKESAVLAPDKVRVDFSKPNAKFLDATSTVSLGIVAPATSAKSADQRCAGGIVGSGPFVLSSFTRDQQVTETARKGYTWAASGSAHQGPAYLDRIVFKIVTEDGVRLGGLQSSQFAGISDLTSQDRQALTGGGATVLSRAIPGLATSINVNTSRPFISDRTVRLALASAVDRSQIIAALGPGYSAATSVLSSTTTDYTDLRSRLATDAAAASKSLDGDGWVRGGDGIRVKNGVRLQLTVVWFGEDPVTQSALELVQQQFKAIGVGLTLHPVPTSGALAAFKSGDYDLVVGDSSNADPDILRIYYTAEGLNAVRLSAGPLQTALFAQSTQADPAKRAALVSQAQQQLIGDGYAIPLFEQSSAVALSTSVHGVALDTVAHPLFYDAWLS
ncbi:ABC transporter substrate-binding protein [Protofrankia symbiont of Coriaria ruscifolia]|uniref:ABC transporter substrate-binding protein n=1 Tax=Protofrankia symbiont of Coriaria ruscifolia TaxID=1306542 RepID=UPI0013EF6B51|nr:ABC transporter substrate-binding protein [Protofrankia symbiont of Coriaria ruscifolia]